MNDAPAPTSQTPGCIAFVFRLLPFLSPRDPSKPTLPYRRKDYLLSRAERSFFGVLEQAVAGRYRIFVKVRLADLLYLPKGTVDRQSHFNRIQSKHIDFVLTDVDTLRPLLAIELDDASHDRTDRRRRDDFLRSTCLAAGLPLLNITARSTYHVAEIARSIADSIEAA